MEVRVNPDYFGPGDGVYIIPSGPGGKYIGTLGVKRAAEKGARIAEWAECPGPDPDLIGTPEGYQDYLRILDAARALYDETGESCPVDLTPQLVGLEGYRVEVVDKHGDRRRFWVGRSSGWVPCHIEIHNSRSHGGPAVMGAPFQSVRIVREGPRPLPPAPRPSAQARAYLDSIRAALGTDQEAPEGSLQQYST